jgi:glycosyltransferase involved in cell wall biosynthesis
MNVVFLYTELAGYSIACMQAVIRNYPTVKITVIRWPLNKEAPFKFNFDGLDVYEKNTFGVNELLQFVQQIKPSLLICSGWIDKDYVKVCKSFKGKVPTVLAIDNQWTGRFRQQVARLVSGFTLKRYFSHVWVPGTLQCKYAQKLGFKLVNIKDGFYAADTDLYSNYFEKYKKNKLDLPKRFLYTGRYVYHKGIFDLWQAFIELQNEVPSEWELWCVGTGNEWENRVEHPKIKHLGFIQPNEMNQVIKDTAWYILPSHFEPWGVSLHEFTAAGFPIIVSTNVGSAEQFLSGNGFVFQSGNIEELKDVMRNAMNVSEDSYRSMSRKSNQLAQQNTPDIWAKTLLSFINDKSNKD